jgi:hypothetical protein
MAVTAPLDDRSILLKRHRLIPARNLLSLLALPWRMVHFMETLIQGGIYEDN